MYAIRRLTVVLFLAGKTTGIEVSGITQAYRVQIMMFSSSVALEAGSIRPPRNYFTSPRHPPASFLSAANVNFRVTESHLTVDNLKGGDHSLPPHLCLSERITRLTRLTMASSILQTVASPQLRDCEEVFGSAFFQLKAQLIEGHQEPVVSFSEVSLLGLQGLEDLETKLGEVFGVSMAIDVDLVCGHEPEDCLYADETCFADRQYCQSSASAQHDS